MPLPTQILRVWLAAGHGLSNSLLGVFDPGATSCYGGEHEIVSRVTDQVLDYFYFARDEHLSPTEDFSVVEVPRCSARCASKHPSSGHLAWQIKYLNDNRAPFDYIVALHMNAADNPEASGALVVYDNAAPKVRQRQAYAAAEALAATLGIQNRGATKDSDTPRESIGIVEKTRSPALLFELGFVTNKKDVKAVRECGRDAVIAALKAIRGR